MIWLLFMPSLPLQTEIFAFRLCENRFVNVEWKTLFIPWKIKFRVYFSVSSAPWTSQTLHSLTLSTFFSSRCLCADATCSKIRTWVAERRIRNVKRKSRVNKARPNVLTLHSKRTVDSLCTITIGGANSQAQQYQPFNSSNVEREEREKERRKKSNWFQ